jgi:hypothetical protein
MQPRYWLAAPLLAVLAAPVSAQDLRYRTAPGEVLRYKLKSSDSISYKADHGKVTESSIQEQVLDFAPAPDGDGLIARYRENRTVRATSEFPFAYDSAKAYTPAAIAKDPVLGILEGFIGDGYRVRLSETGEVRVWGMAELAQRASWRGLDGNPATGILAAKALLEVLGDTEVQQSLGLVFVELPRDAGAGSKWTRDAKETIAGILFTHAFEFAIPAVSGGKATITIGGAVKVSVDGQSIPTQGTIAGSAGFDGATGRLLFCKWKSALKLPNVQMNASNEFTLVKAVPVAEAGPASYERPVKTGTAVLARRRAHGRPGVPLPLSGGAASADALFFACHGDELRVLETVAAEGTTHHRVMDARGRIGWINDRLTVPVE